MLVGLPWVEDGSLYNAVALLNGGRIEAVRFKVDLPNYGVFDEKRVFRPGPAPGPLVFKGVRIGVPICEDIWGPEPVECIAETGGEILLVPNASPYERDKLAIRQSVAVARVVESGLPMIYLNQVGGQDELVFEGGSFVLNADRSLAVQLPGFRASVARTVWERGANGWRCAEGERALVEQGDEGDYAACVMGLRDYVDNNRFPGVVLGLSGGVDSALCAAMAVDALGAARVHAVMLPYRFTSSESLRDAEACAKALGIRYDVVPIAGPVESVEAALAPLFRGRDRDITEENIQSRARGLILMSISNKFGAMVVTTGNKSEMSVGYATLYGDMNGGFNPIKDLYKLEVFRLCELRNRWKPFWRARPRRDRRSRRDHHEAAVGRVARGPEGRGFAAALRDLGRDPAPPRRERNARRRHHRRRLRSRHRAPRRAPLVPRRIQAPAVRARGQGRAEEFRPRPALSDRQPLPRPRPAGGRARRVARAEGQRGRERAVRGIAGATIPGFPMRVAPHSPARPCRSNSADRRTTSEIGRSCLASGLVFRQIIPIVREGFSLSNRATDTDAERVSTSTAISGSR